MDTQWRIDLFGGLRAEQAGRAITRFRTQKTGALLAYLAYYYHRSHPREVLIELLWPEFPLETGRASLSTALSALRRELEPPEFPAGTVLVADRAVVRLNANAIVTDVAQFGTALDAAAGAGSSDERAPRLREAVELYRGELLSGYFEDWVLQERQWLEGRFFEALGQLLYYLETRGEFHRALQYAQQGVRADPLREEAQRNLMRLYAAAGQPAEALRQYSELERLLREQLAVTPDTATRTLAHDIERLVTAASRSGLPTPAAALERSETAPASVVLLYRRDVPLDRQLLETLEMRLVARGYTIFVDRHPAASTEWAKELEHQLHSTDNVIILLSRASAQSEMLAYEIQMAQEIARQRNGLPRLLPVRIGETGPLPESLAGVVEPLDGCTWNGPQDDEAVAEQLVSALQARASPEPESPPTSPPRRKRPLVVGAVPLDSAFYVIRSTDEQFRAAIAGGDSIILVKGARQMGKTSLLARGLQQAREAGAQVIRTDLQLLDSADLESPDRLVRVLAEWIADQLKLDVLPETVWKSHLGASVNLTRYLQQEVLPRVTAPVVWGLDEVDRLFGCDFGSQVFGMFRSWHNDRVLDPSGPWSGLTLAMAYATEHHLFISDLNQSPFNVGTRLTLEEFTPEQVADLNRRYGSPLRDAAELRWLLLLVGGHPYLVHRGLHEMAARGIDIRALEVQADRSEGIFGDHLRRLLVSLARDPDLCEAVRAVLRGGRCPSEQSFYRLRSAGVLAGESARDARLRCQLYATYLGRHLQ